MSHRGRVRFIDKDKLTLEEYLETEFLEGLDYGFGANGWRAKQLERENRRLGKLPKPKLGDEWVSGLDTIPWGVFEQALADAHTKAPTIVEPYLKTYLAIPKRSLASSFKEFNLTYVTMRRVRRDAIALIRGCLPIKARRILAMVERERESEENLLKSIKKKLKAEAKQLLSEAIDKEK